MSDEATQQKKSSGNMFPLILLSLIILYCLSVCPVVFGYE